jgi:hypothetical protein
LSTLIFTKPDWACAGEVNAREIANASRDIPREIEPLLPQKGTAIFVFIKVSLIFP